MIAPEGIEYFSHSSALSDVHRSALTNLAFENGSSYASYLATDDGWESMWLPNQRGVVCFVRWGKYAMVVCGLLADPPDQEELLVEFMRFAKKNRLHVSFYNIGRDDLGLFRRNGFQVTKFGEEPIVQLDQTSWKGKEYSWLRRQESYGKRAGLQFEEIEADESDPIYRDEIAPELAEISRQHIASTVHGREMQFFVGKFSEDSIGQKRLFVVRSESRIEAFVVCNPAFAGTMWAVEMYRRRNDAVRGAVPYAILQTMRLLKEEGVQFFSLSLIPGLRCDQAVTNDSWIARPAMVFLWNQLNWVFDFRGIYHFKSRFRPAYRDLYIVAQPNATVMSMLAVGFTWGLLRISPNRLFRRGLDHWRRREQRRLLATPDESRRVVKRLDRHRTLTETPVCESKAVPVPATTTVERNVAVAASSGISNGPRSDRARTQGKENQLA